MTLIGLYHEGGYSIETANGPTLYSAGNHRQDSEQHAELGTPECLSLDEIKLCCRHSLQSLCHELGVRNGGIQYTED